MQSKKNSKGALWAGRVISALLILFLIFDGVTKLAKESHVVQGMAQGGFAPGLIVPFGITVLICTLLYAIPRTSVLGAVLLTGWLGGAVESMVHTGTMGLAFLFPAFFGVLVWLGLYLREERLRQLLPVRKP
jgi:hypothetical protein